MTKATKTAKPAKGVSLDPKTNAEALELLRWMYGEHIPAYVPPANKG